MKRRLIGSLAGLALAAGAMVATVAPASGGVDPLDPQTFDTVGTFDYEVPDGCTAVTVDAFGAEGGEGGGLQPLLGADGGLGAEAVQELTVTGGELLQVNVGGEGGDAPLIDLSTGGAAGANGGGPGGDGLIVAGGGGGGGGASDVRQGGTDLTNRAVVAGGGGGGGSGVLNLLLVGEGGDAGEIGADGQTATLLALVFGGRGGQSGGNGGLGGDDGLAAAGGNGGNGAPGIGGDGGDGLDLLILDLIFGGGGGGGGLTGGGGGGAGQVGLGSGGGGGGNSLGTAFGEGVEPGNGRVIITPVRESCDGGGGVPQCTDPPPLFFQPDATRETPRLGNDIYDDGSGDFQTQVEFVKPRFGSTLDVYIQNDGNQADSFVLTGPPSSPGFLVRYQQLKAADGSLPKNYITEQVIGAGFTTGTLQPCGEMKVRIQVKVSVNAPVGAEANLPLKVTSVGDGDISDTARLIVRVVAP